ncbi:thiol reductant ABC exporter subunit CydC [Actinoplanes sp. NPDC024001]|uniref:thiol reductant ABC exporter subunit CydC n=1 Tax=Actinoplanes sp. NPDC024001 TaxID=3154598 RepID=UPI0033E4B40A
MNRTLTPYTLVKPAAGRLGLAVLAGAGAAGAAITLTAVSAWLISRAALHPPVLHLMVAIVAVRACGLGRGVLRYLERLLGHDAAFRILGDLRVRVYTRLERLAPAGLAGYRGADLAQRLAADVDAVVDLITRVVLPYTVAAIVGLASVLVVGALVPAAGLTLAVALLVVAVGVPVLQQAAARRADGRLAPLRGELTTGVVDLLHGLQDLSAYGRTGAHLAGLEAVDARLTAAQRRSAAAGGLSAAVTVLSTGACVLAGLVAGTLAVRAGDLSGELLALVVLTPMAVFEIAGPLPVAAQHYAAARASLRRLSDLPTPPRPRTVAGELAWERPRINTRGWDRAVPEVRVMGASAEWVPGWTAVRDVDLVLRPGARVALTGPSGSGKSTVAALLVRFLEPRAGRITLDGTELREIAPERVREVVGYLPEDAYLFDTTIGANLRIGRPEATDGELWAALKSACLDEFVAGLPDGLETLVGEHGMALSGGQRRRLGLARLLLTDVRVLILDEPTEHLDEATADALTRDLLAAAGERTVLLITHRTAGLEDFELVRM